MAPQVRDKWRPTLTMIVYAVLLAVLALPAGFVVWFRAIDKTSSQFGLVEFLGLGVALALTLVIGFVFSRTLTGPINALMAWTEAVGKGRRDPRLTPDRQGTREIAVLSQSFLDLAGRLVDRTEYVQSFAVHVSHELKSPLTSIRGAAELIRDGGMSEAERARFLDHIIADSDRLAKLLDRLRELAMAERGFPGGSTDAEELASELRLRFPRLIISVTGTAKAKMALSIESATIICGHLADNALQHGATELQFAIEQRENTVRLEIADNGSGISEGNRALVFQPFFTTRRETGGTGMGLQIARAMLQSQGGNIELLPSETGARFEITVPRAAAD
jgi:two-component system, OmpR family, sensor kinase